MILDADTRHAAALILRWSAQLAAGEDAVTLSGCRAPLRDYGYNLDLLEPLVADLAREVLTYVALAVALAGAEKVEVVPA